MQELHQTPPLSQHSHTGGEGNIHAVIKDHLNRSLATLLKERWYLLEINPLDIFQMHIKHQQDWLNVMVVAQVVGAKTVEFTNRKISSGTRS